MPRCTCGRGSYSDPYTSCYECYLDRRADYEDCIWCGRWHSPQFTTCYQCRQRDPGREEAAKHLRRVILARDHFACSYCGTVDYELQVDHVLPCAKAGTADQWNLQTLCVACNYAKGSTYTRRDYDARGRLIEAYSTYLYDFLDAAERDRLRDAIDDWLDR